MLQKEVEQTIHRFNLLKNNDRIIVAISGGPDSVALTYLLARLKKKWQLYLHLAHLNHMLRKQEADRDKVFVQGLAKKLGLSLTYAQLNIREFSRNNKLSIEEAAREARYNFLLQVAEDNFAGKIAMGHTQDDQAETVLMRFLRGSGISGLRGIPPKRKSGNCFVIRPLIQSNRRQILDFLSAKNISFCTDSTNLNILYFRNRVRNQLLPRLEKGYNPNIKQMLVNFAENVSCDFDFLQRAGQARFKALTVSADEDKVAINLKKFLSLHKALQKLVSRSAITRLKGNTRQIDYRHWKELEELLLNRPKNSIVDLPGGISIVRKDKYLVFYLR